MKNKTLIVIAGPTAVGKTSLAIRLAEHLQTPIISADSRQCFRELNIGVARPDPQQLQQVHHYFINSHSVNDEVNAAVFEQLAMNWTEQIFRDHDITVMVGGTGLYIKAVCEGLDEMPGIDPATRSHIQFNYREQGLKWLQESVEKEDPEFYGAGEIQNPQRMMRALEVKRSTGQSILFFRTRPQKQRDFSIIKIGLDLPKEQLHENINHRTNQMIKDGLVEEVRSLLAFRNRNALQTVGYTELFNYLDGNLSLQEATERIRKNTRQYAKRQLTWFRKDPDFRWIHPEDWEALQKIIKR